MTIDEDDTIEVTSTDTDELICTGPIELRIWPDLKPEVAASWREHNARTRHAPTPMQDEGYAEWIEPDGTAWHIYCCPICLRVTVAT